MCSSDLYEMELAGRTLRVDIGRVCAQANGAALMHYGDTVVLSTATASKSYLGTSRMRLRKSRQVLSVVWYLKSSMISSQRI